MVRTDHLLALIVLCAVYRWGMSVNQAIHLLLMILRVFCNVIQDVEQGAICVQIVAGKYCLL